MSLVGVPSERGDDFQRWARVFSTSDPELLPLVPATMGEMMAYVGGLVRQRTEKPEDDLLTVDHVQPRIRGGDRSGGNLVTACGACNARKGSMRLAEPKMPRWCRSACTSPCLQTTSGRCARSRW